MRPPGTRLNDGPRRQRDNSLSNRQRKQLVNWRDNERRRQLASTLNSSRSNKPASFRSVGRRRLLKWPPASLPSNRPKLRLKH